MSIKEKVCVAQKGAPNKKCNASENTYYVFMRVTDETIRDFDLNPNDITWKLIGHEKCRGINIATTKEVYEAYTRPEWAEDKRNRRNSRCRVPGKDGKLIRCPQYIPDPDAKVSYKMKLNQCKDCENFEKVCREKNKVASLDVLKEEGIEMTAPGSLEESILLKVMLDELISYLITIKPTYGKIIQMCYEGYTQTETAQELDMKQRTVSDDIRKIRQLVKDFMKD